MHRFPLLVTRSRLSIQKYPAGRISAFSFESLLLLGGCFLPPQLLGSTQCLGSRVLVSELLVDLVELVVKISHGVGRQRVLNFLKCLLVLSTRRIAFCELGV